MAVEPSGGTVRVTIANGQTLSGEAFCGATALALIRVPVDWDGGDITVHGQAGDTSDWVVANSQVGVPFVFSPVANQWCGALMLDTVAYRSIKLKAATAVGAAREIICVFVPLDGRGIGN